MVTIISVSQLTVTLTVSSAMYDMEEKKAKLILNYKIHAGPYVTSYDIPLEVQVDEPSIAEVERLLDEKRTKLNAGLDRVKKPIESLLKLTSSVDINLKQFADQLMKEAGVEIPKEKKG